MVRLYGPLMSLDASGTIADAVTFSKWKGRNYARQRVIPSTPNSVSQQSIRAMMKFLSQGWAAVSAADKADWQTRADQSTISTFNAFVGYNLERWRAFRLPSKTDPADETGVAPAAPTTTVSTGVRELMLSIADGAQLPDWEWLIFRSTVTGFTPSFSNLVHVIIKTATPTLFIDGGLNTGVPYFYRVAGGMATGKWGALEAQKTGTPT
jgi:hypothetical protein